MTFKNPFSSDECAVTNQDARFHVGYVPALSFFICWVILAAVMHFVGVGQVQSRALSDEIKFHLPTIQHFLTGGSVADYPSATTPGYHWLLSIWARLVGGGVDSMRIGSALFTAWMAYLAVRVWQKSGFSLPWLWVLPLMCALYTFPSGLWLLPDNLAWAACFAVIVLSPMDSAEDWTQGRTLIIGLMIAFALWVRQTNLWLIALPLMYFFTAAVQRRDFPRWIKSAVLVVLPAALLLLYFYIEWGGMTPPTFQSRHQGANLAAPVWLLVYVFVANVWFLPFLIRAYRSLNHDQHAVAAWVYGGAAVAFLLSVIPETSYLPVFRAGGLWEVVRRTPEWMGRSIFVSAMALAGGAFLGALLAPMAMMSRLRVIALLIAFSACLALNKATYDRYYYGLAAILVPLAMGQWRWSVTQVRVPRYWVLGVFLFSMLLLVMSIYGIRK